MAAVSFSNFPDCFLSANCYTQTGQGNGVLLPSSSGTGVISFWYNLASFINSQGIGGGYAYNNVNIISVSRGPGVGKNIAKYSPSLFPITLGAITPNAIDHPVQNTLLHFQISFTRPNYNAFTAGQNFLQIMFTAQESINPYYAILNVHDAMPANHIVATWGNSGDGVICDDKWHHCMICFDTNNFNPPQVYCAIDGTLMTTGAFDAGQAGGTAPPPGGDSFNGGHSMSSTPVYKPFVPFKMQFGTDSVGLPLKCNIGEFVLNLSELYVNVCPKTLAGADLSYVDLCMNPGRSAMTAATSYFLEGTVPPYAAYLGSKGELPFNVSQTKLITKTATHATSAPLTNCPPQIYLSGNSANFNLNTPQTVFHSGASGFPFQFVKPAYLYDYMTYTGNQDPFNPALLA